jgi:competence protein ComEC
MAISGLHIGLVAGLGLGVLAWLWRRLPGPCARVPALVAGAVFGLAAAGLYAALAGFGLPTQRALIMLAVAALALVARRDARPSGALALALVLVLSWHPPSVLSAGFWLSFGAVLVIFAVLRIGHGWPVWRQALAVQFALGIALWPVLGVFGLPASTVAPLVNLLLVPLFGALIVPGSLAVVLLTPLHGDLAAWLGGHLGGLLDLVQVALAHAAGWPWPTLAQPAPAPAVLLALAAGLGLLLAPPGIPLRGLALPLLLVGLLPREPAITHGAFDLHLLDVGQGLASVILTRNRTLVFDSGPEYPGGFNAAEAVVEPFLRRLGRDRIDRLVLSHGDSDHAGGVDHLRRTLAIGQLLTGEVERIGGDAGPCIAGTAWDWDGVRFEILHPPQAHRLEGNDASCVLRVANAAGSVLLTGDIGRRVERELVAREPGRLRSDVVLAPHHGSRSSSSETFVAATAPRYVLYAAGWANRFGFPADEVAMRWHAAGARAVNTASAGTVSLSFDPRRPDAVPRLHRTERGRFWSHRGGSAGTGHAVSSGHR